MKKAILYARFSPRPNADECDSIQRQTEDMERYCQKEGYKVVGKYSDEALSGASDDRPGMWDALYALKKGYTLIVRSFDRLYRDTTMGLYVIRTEIEKKGARILSITDAGASEDSPDARLVRGILLMLAEYQREIIRAKTRAAMRRYQSEGRVMSCKIPYGYLRDTKDPKQMNPYEPEQEVIRLMFILKGNGESLRGIARILTERGIKTKEGNEWHHNQVKRILEREKANFKNDAS
jgi:DNA invertase Pin-like site-specific DNA recombinase